MNSVEETPSQSHNKTFSELHGLIGTTLPSGDWFLVDQNRINQFADVTEDHQFIHINPEQAAKTDLKGTIAHGFLTLSLLSKIAEKSMLGPESFTMAINYGFDKVRFISPVRPGDYIRVNSTVKAVQDKGPGRILITHQMEVEIKGQAKPALVCEWLSLFEGV